MSQPLSPRSASPVPSSHSRPTTPPAAPPLSLAPHSASPSVNTGRGAVVVDPNKIHKQAVAAGRYMQQMKGLESCFEEYKKNNGDVSKLTKLAGVYCEIYSTKGIKINNKDVELLNNVENELKKKEVIRYNTASGFPEQVVQPQVISGSQANGSPRDEQAAPAGSQPPSAIFSFSPSVLRGPGSAFSPLSVRPRADDEKMTPHKPAILPPSIAAQSVSLTPPPGTSQSPSTMAEAGATVVRQPVVHSSSSSSQPAAVSPAAQEHSVADSDAFAHLWGELVYKNDGTLSHSTGQLTLSYEEVLKHIKDKKIKKTYEFYSTHFGRRKNPQTNNDEVINYISTVPSHSATTTTYTLINIPDPTPLLSYQEIHFKPVLEKLSWTSCMRAKKVQSSSTVSPQELTLPVFLIQVHGNKKYYIIDKSSKHISQELIVIYDEQNIKYKDISQEAKQFLYSGSLKRIEIKSGDNIYKFEPKEPKDIQYKFLFPAMT